MGKSCVCFSTAGLLTWDLGRSRGRSPQGQQGQPGHLGIGLTALGPGSGVPTAVCGLRAPVRAGLAVSEGSSQSLELWVGSLLQKPPWGCARLRCWALCQLRG